MSVVNHETGELIDLDRTAAERRAERIRLRLDTIADNYEAVMPLIREAIGARDDLALGYRSVGEYVADRFGGSMQRLGVEMRRAVVHELTAAGMSTRAIAPIVGVNNATVHRDLNAGVADATPDPAPQDEQNSESGGDDPAPTEATSWDNRPTDYPVAPAPAARPAVTGLDGKTYARPAPIDHRAKADVAVAEFPDLAYFRDEAVDLEHCWRLADTLRGFGPTEQATRLETLRRSIELDRSQRSSRHLKPVPDTCPTCGQNVRN